MFRDESVQSNIEACHREIVYLNAKEELSEDVTNTLTLVIEKLKSCTSNGAKRSKERSLEEASQLLRRVQAKRLRALEVKCILPFARLLISMQLDMSHISTACRKLDQMLQQLSEVNHSVVLEETKACVMTLVQKEQILSAKDLQTVCMFLEDSTMGREVCRQICPSLLSRVAEVFAVTLEQDASRNGERCYLAVKVCLQVFQLLHREVAHLVWEKNSGDSAVQSILKHLMSIILGETSNRDARLLSGTAVAMLINTSPEARGDGGLAAQSLLQVTSADPWLLCVGGLRVECRPSGSDGVDRLAVTRGLLTCCRKDVLTGPLDNNGTCLILDGLFPVVSALCEEKLDCHYYVFQVFTLWLRCLKDCLEEVWEVRGAPLLQEDHGLRRQLTRVIWNNAESPLEGVSEFVYGSFRLLLEVYQLDCRRFGGAERPLYLALLRRISSLPWQAKAKYPPLSALLPYVGTSTVLEHFPELPRHLLKCFSTNHLSPCASDVYKSVIHQQRRELCGGVGQDAAPPSEAELAEEWARRWRPTLLEALTSDVTLLQGGATGCLLPCTLRTFPGAFGALLAPLEPGRPGHLRAWTSVMSARRAASAAPPPDDARTAETLRLALGSLDDGVRLAALNLLCCSPKTSQPPTGAELSAVRGFLPLNLNCESAPFRQHLQVALRKLLVRLRDSCLARLKARRGRGRGGARQGTEEEEDDTELEQGVDFVDWLAQLPFAYLAPGHSYQRKRTVLLLLSAVLETCTDTWRPDKKKGQPPANVSDLIGFARRGGRWDFFARQKLLVLIGCLEDSTNEVRELAAGLLLRFFPRPLPPDLGPALLERAGQLLRSPRVQDGQTGALFFRVLLEMCGDAAVFPERDGAALSADTRGGMADAVLRVLLRELEEHYLTAKSDLLLAAKTRPIHGVLAALQKCLLDGSDTLGPVQKAVLPLSVADAILDLLERVSRLLLGVLYGDQAACAEETEAPPSFCDMGNAIRSVIAQGGGQGVGEGEDEDCVLLSEEHSLVLTCCWVSLKEIGIFLGSFVDNAMATPCSIEAPLTAEYLKRASAVFKDILLKCRHWGAVEGCCVGFTKFCAALLSNGDPELQEVPARMLKQGLSVLQAPRGTSITRRAAGLPMLILCVAAAEDASKSRPLLALSVATLLETAGAPVPQSWDQTVDLPQVCAVHTLQALVRGSGLGVAVLQYASSMTILSLQLLSSPCWAMRNAALQLYSTLCSRMLGQRPGGDEGSSQHGMSPQAFFVHYPALQPFLLGELRQAAGDSGAPPGGARLHLHPSLFPVLTLLGKLQPGVHDEARCLSAFLPPLLRLAASSIHNVRTMAARALVVMTPPAEYAGTLLRLARGLPAPPDPRCHNRLHGQLLQIRAVLARALDPDSTHLDSELSEVVECFESKLWLVTSSQRCPLIRSSYLSGCALLARFFSASFLDQLQAVLLSELQNPSSLKLQIGSASFLQNAVHFLCEEAARTGDSRWAGQAWRNLPALSADARLSLVGWAADGRSLGDGGLQRVVEEALRENLKVALQDSSVEYRRLYLAALVAVLSPSDPGLPRATPPPSPPQGDLEECAELLLGALEAEGGGPELLSQSLRAVSLLLAHCSSPVELTQRWCGLLEVYRAPEAPEVLRLACAQALRLAGAPVVSGALGGHSPHAALAPRLLGTALHLLQDEDARVRAEAARFASAVGHARRARPGGGEPCFQMQANLALRRVLDLLLEEFWDSCHTLEALLGQLPQCGLSALLGDVQLTACASLYEQDEPNVFAEPAVMSERLLPYLLRLAAKVPESPCLADRLLRWARENVADVQENVGLCKQLYQGETAAPAWLPLAVEPRFHRGLCGLFARAGLLLELLDAWEELRSLCCPLWLRAELQQAYQLLYLNGVLLPESIPANIGLRRPV
ncbi:LOW QUALITY PROTEIN: thyroid adenoma-associated protein homolog [Anguilla anguilla]|uniref:LOW QUALITY PROTEIN: thyroid adenoma-associated protein homolog n=1 Tax=Anguilla anguilla TaxID=7936 RepID=UPI0015B1C0AA|nr:LOW QUALITY PROTEIN: thyroid adenoma-associated protein homolog [Anguilla anguilla]